MLKEATVALIVRKSGSDPSLVEILSDDREISLYEKLVREGDKDPLVRLREFRQRQLEEDEAFGDYVEELLSQPFLRKDIRDHGVQWLKSKMRIEQYQQTEAEAARVIAEFALKLLREDPQRVDFNLAGPTSQVRVRVFATEEPLAEAA